MARRSISLLLVNGEHKDVPCFPVGKLPCFLYGRSILGHLIFRHRIYLLKFRHFQDMVSIAELVILSYSHFYCQQRDEDTSLRIKDEVRKGARQNSSVE